MPLSVFCVLYILTPVFYISDNEISLGLVYFYPLPMSDLCSASQSHILLYSCSSDLFFSFFQCPFFTCPVVDPYLLSRCTQLSENFYDATYLCVFAPSRRMCVCPVCVDLLSSVSARGVTMSPFRILPTYP